MQTNPHPPSYTAAPTDYSYTFFIRIADDTILIALADIKKSKRGAIARALTLVENEPLKAHPMLQKIFPSCGKAIIIGVTGPAGAGKSSLIAKTAVRLASLGMKPAVLAIDPSSHITGGAIMGDRARMRELDEHDIYVRSIASRGATGAISASLRNCIRILEYAKYDPIIVESVGAGQTDVDIATIADITIVLFSPNTGDSIQAIKAGLTEIGDIYVVNKSDLSGAGQLYESVKEFITTAGTKDEIVALKTSIKRPASITKLAEHIQKLVKTYRPRKKLRYAQTLEFELQDIVLNNIKERAISVMSPKNKTYTKYVDSLRAGKTDPYTVAKKIVRLCK